MTLEQAKTGATPAEGLLRMFPEWEQRAAAVEVYPLPVVALSTPHFADGGARAERTGRPIPLAYFRTWWAVGNAPDLYGLRRSARRNRLKSEFDSYSASVFRSAPGLARKQ